MPSGAADVKPWSVPCRERSWAASPAARDSSRSSAFDPVYFVVKIQPTCWAHLQGRSIDVDVGQVRTVQLAGSPPHLFIRRRVSSETCCAWGGPGLRPPPATSVARLWEVRPPRPSLAVSKEQGCRDHVFSSGSLNSTSVLLEGSFFLSRRVCECVLPVWSRGQAGRFRQGS